MIEDEMNSSNIVYFLMSLTNDGLIASKRRIFDKRKIFKDK
jgi:hypothetical protein